MRELLYTVGASMVMAIAGFMAGYFYKECPKPPNPAPIIEEVEKIRYVDKPVYKTITKTVEKVVEKPFYINNQCLDKEGLDTISTLINQTAAGKPLP